jgi:hypothetical protein
MTTFYGPICLTFRGGPNQVIAYDTIVAPTVVHGPTVPIVLIGDVFPIIKHFTPLINPDDTDTIGRVGLFITIGFG